MANTGNMLLTRYHLELDALKAAEEKAKKPAPAAEGEQAEKPKARKSTKK